jgi:hypothetical protein
MRFLIFGFLVQRRAERGRNRTLWGVCDLVPCFGTFAVHFYDLASLSRGEATLRSQQRQLIIFIFAV